MDNFIISAACIFWVTEAVRDFTENKWGSRFFMDALNATVFIGLLIWRIFMQ